MEHSDSEGKEHLERKLSHRSRDVAAYKFIICMCCRPFRNEIDDRHSEEGSECAAYDSRSCSESGDQSSDAVEHGYLDPSLLQSKSHEDQHEAIARVTQTHCKEKEEEY